MNTKSILHNHIWYGLIWLLRKAVTVKAYLFVLKEMNIVCHQSDSEYLLRVILHLAVGFSVVFSLRHYLNPYSIFLILVPLLLLIVLSIFKKAKKNFPDAFEDIIQEHSQMEGRLVLEKILNSSVVGEKNRSRL